MSRFSQVALTRFRRALPRARRQVRELTHTLNLPPAQSELYDGPHPQWLRDVLEKLPNLQCLVVSQIPFFDHPSLLALKSPSAGRAASSLETIPSFPLRLLIATQCPNTTSAGLIEAFIHWPNLVFLDLSETLPAKDVNVLSGLEQMTSLQVLKLRHIGLRDKDCEIIAEAVKTRLRSLDVRDNLLTDESVRILLTQCFHRTRNIQAAQRRAHQQHEGDEDWPTGISRPAPYILEQFRGDDMDERFVKGLTQAVVGRMPTEDLPPTGITHLYIANNYITVEGLASLVKTQNLHVLDAGDLDTVKALGRPRAHSSLSSPVAQSFFVPGAEKLTGVLEKFAVENLTFLRLHHAVLTSPVATKDDDLIELSSSEPSNSQIGEQSELSGQPSSRQELRGDSDYPAELDSAAPICELSDDTPAPRYELSGEPIQIVVSPAPDKTAFPRDLSPPPPLGSPASAPEVVSEEEDELVLTPTGLSAVAQAANGISLSGIETSAISSLTLEDRNVVTREPAGLIARLTSRRHALRNGIKDSSRGLLPGRLPHLRTLILTEIPLITTSKTLLQNMKSFIIDCAIEHYLAVSQADAEAEHASTLAPNLHPQSSSRSSTFRSSSIFALEKIILELAPIRSGEASYSNNAISPPPQPPLSPRSPSSPQFPNMAASYIQKRPKNWSSTEDADTQAFWNAAENDFSFFGEGPGGSGEECGLPAVEPESHFPISSLGEKIPLVSEADEESEDDRARDERSPSPIPGTQNASRQPVDGYPRGKNERNSRAVSPSRLASQIEKGGEMPREQAYDVIAELARWRAERKRAFERVVAEGGMEFVEGYWPGEIKIVRPTKGKRGGDVDWYGNYFERGVYR